MTLFEALRDFSFVSVNHDNKWYQWQINETSLPLSIKLLPGTNYQQNHKLKEELHLRFKHSAQNSVERLSLLNYYISEWGGIRANKEGKLEEYAKSAPIDLIGRGKDGIASWSKALVLHNPDKYAIYDARVAVSLNCLQVDKQITKKELYPLLPSRNKKIEKANTRLKHIAVVDGWQKRNSIPFMMSI